MMLDLDALAAEAPKTARLFGRAVAVHPITAGTLHRILSASQSNDIATQLAVFTAAVKNICPELTADEVDRLTHQQILAIIQLAQGDVEAVESAIRERAGETTGGRGDGPA